MTVPAVNGGLVTLGETMGTLTSSVPGVLSRSCWLRLSHAGSESNVAIGVRRLGLPATWIGRVGRDAVGELILRELTAEGVTCLAIRDPAPTALMLKHRRTADITQVDYCRAGSAGSNLWPGDVPEAVVAAADVLHVTGITLALGPAAAAAAHRAVDIAKAAGVTVSLDLNYRAALWTETEARESLSKIIGRVDVVFASPNEARLVTSGDTPPQLAAALAAAGPTQAVLKLGAEGAYALVGQDAHEVAAARVGVADPVGAGDAFVAGYLAELMAGGTPQDRLATAAAAGAFAVATTGDWEGLPRRDELSLLRPADNVLR